MREHTREGSSSQNPVFPELNRRARFHHAAATRELFGKGDSLVIEVYDTHGTDREVYQTSMGCRIAELAIQTRMAVKEISLDQRQPYLGVFEDGGSVETRIHGVNDGLSHAETSASPRN